MGRCLIHEPGFFDGDVTILAATRDNSDRGSNLSQGWRPHLSGDIFMYLIELHA